MKYFPNGTRIRWVQGGDGSDQFFGYNKEGTIICVVRKGESMFAALKKNGFKPKPFTVDIGKRWDRYLVSSESARQSISDYATPRVQNVYRMEQKHEA